MKSFKTLLALVLAVMLISPISASAATSAGVKPGSFWYGFDIAFEKINLFFTFNPEKKVQKALEYADERLAEAEAVANENKPEAVATAMINYQENISLATAESKEIKNKEKAQNLLSTIADNTSKHQEVLAEVYNKVPAEAKKAIENAIEISIKGREEALKEIQGLKKTVEELQKDIESLKQQGQSDQSKEIEVLRKEVETLKSQQSSQSAKPQVIEKVVEKIVEIPPTVPQKSTAKLSNSEIIEKVKPAVVYIQTSDGSGSGMITESNGYVLTNAHVVSGVNTAKIKLSDGRLFIGSVVGRDEKIDLALLKINGENFPIVILGDSSVDALKQGDEVFAFGYPFGLEGDVSFKEGTISRRQIYEGTTYLETSAQIHPGNSGGPLVNKYGEVVGINAASYGQSIKGIAVGETIKLAIPINLARGLIPELKSGRNVTLPKTTLPALPSSPTPAPTPTPTPVPTPSPTPIPTPKPEPKPIIEAQIISVNISPDITSVKFEWQTNIPTNSKVFIWNDSTSKKVVNSISGISTSHIASASGLFANQTYSYEIEVITSDYISIKKSGEFKTKELESNFSMTQKEGVADPREGYFLKTLFQFTATGESFLIEAITVSVDSFEIAEKLYPIYQNFSGTKVQFRQCQNLESIFQEFSKTSYPYDCPGREFKTEEEFNNAAVLGYSIASKDWMGRSWYSLSVKKDTNVDFYLPFGTKIEFVKAIGELSGKVIILK